MRKEVEQSEYPAWLRGLDQFDRRDGDWIRLEGKVWFDAETERAARIIVEDGESFTSFWTPKQALRLDNDDSVWLAGWKYAEVFR